MADKTATLLVKLKDMASAGVSKLKTAMGGLKTAIAGAGVAFTALGGFLAKSFSAWGVQREAVLKLDTALKNVEGTTPGASARLQELAAQLQKTTTFGDETIISMQSMLASFGMNEQAIAKLTPRILDMATATGTDLNSAALAVGKAISTQSIGALSRYGLALDETKFKSDAVGSVTEQLTKQFGGQAEAVRTGPAGALAALKNTYGDLQEAIGKIIEGPMMDFILRLQDVMSNIQNNEEALKKISGVVLDVGNGIIDFGTVVVRSFDFVGRMIGTIAFQFFKLGSAIWNLVTGDVKGAMQDMKDFTFVANEEIKSAWADLTASMRDENEARRENDLEDKEAIQEQQAEHNEAMLEIDLEKDAEDEALLLKKQERIKKEQEAKKKQRSGELKEQMAFDNKIKDWVKAKHDEQATIKYQFYQNLKFAREQAQKDEITSMQSTFATIATLSQSQNKTLAAIGKAAAIANAIMNTAVGVSRALGAFPPPFNFAMAAAVGAAGAAQIATISGVNLAEGGIIMPTEGGTIARIAEAGKPEAVIPLEEAEDTIGNNITVNINAGTLVADDEGISQLARMLDTKFYDMKRNNESVAF